MTRTKLLLAAAIAVAFSNVAAAAESKSATLVVEGMTCAGCPVTVKRLLKKTPGVTEVSVDAKTHLAQVKFDPDKTQAEQLAKAVTEIGYPTTVK
ncbi:MAG: heavy-metal-associated domain-containing protein [Betaproteobacteria bacterium]|nr:heavy-metal-associated domain-containing protein [Betaproteobacteria bacterium]